jgi:hypothetical protein
MGAYFHIVHCNFVEAKSWDSQLTKSANVSINNTGVAAQEMMHSFCSKWLAQQQLPHKLVLLTFGLIGSIALC